MVGSETGRTELSGPSPRRPGTPALASARIVKRRDVTDDLWIIWIEPDIPFTFKPGQYCTIGVEGIERPYSIVSAPEEPAIELFVELVPEPAGQLTPLLFELGVGDEMTLRPKAKGIFTLDRATTDHVMVSTVTGVVPYVSMLRHFLPTDIGAQTFHILQGGSFKDEFVYDGELGELAASNNAVSYAPTVSRPDDLRNAGWTGRTGRVNTLVEEYLETNALDPATTLVYACGHPGMIEDVKVRMERAGYPFREERFWKE